MNFRKRELASVTIIIERDTVLHEIAGENKSIIAYAHKDDELGNQSVTVEICNKETGEFWNKQFNIPADVAFSVSTKEILEVQK